jgi:glycosyltransferase involved in cell wall biosynthesis
MKAPLISVVIPTHNEAGYVLSAVGSVLSQDFTDVEALVCDDGSTDGTEHLLRGVGDARVRYAKLPHRNANVARNYGLFQARGAYAAFLDGDDEWLPGHLSSCLSAIRREGCDGVYSGMLYQKASGDLVKIPNAKPNAGEPFANFVLRTHLSTQSSGLFMTTESAKSTGWDESLLKHQDYDFVVRYASRYRLLPTGEHTYRYIPRNKGRGIDFRSCIRFIERNKADIGADVYRRYTEHMLRLALSRRADDDIISHYKRELSLC